MDEFTYNSLNYSLVEHNPTHDYVMKSIEISKLKIIISLLTKKEVDLLKSIYYDGLSDRAYATKIGAKQTTISKNHRNLLLKLRKLLNK